MTQVTGSKVLRMTTANEPINGHDIGDVRGHPSLADGNLTIYFESEETRDEFLKTPLNHPYEHSLGKPSEEDDRGG
jgi:hypothetical protein